MDKIERRQDRRYTNQERYLRGAAMHYAKYQTTDDHDHCEFCMDTFSRHKEDLHEGYTTENGYYWVCTKCFHDFKELLQIEETNIEAIE